ncbi:hypothetical protein BVC80_1173g20 [Macleaya cordata]|uniref:SANT/Myb domain n=1 Tax=Macleaya cordata TaxID=56857 RepID=A0A200QIH4_MACCD|nr:hypothetical protein BVC80_1173g20 [Macleaya cordata]
MPKRNSSNCEKPTPIRKSPRLLHQETSKIQEPKSRKSRVCPSPISSSEKPRFNSPFSSTERVNLKETHERYPRNNANDSVRSIDGSNFFSKSANGSRKSSRKIDGVGGFQSLRRSPRFSSSIVRTPELSDKKTRENKPIRKNRELLTDFSDKEISLVVNQKGNLGKTRKSLNGVMGSSRVLEKTEVGIKSMEEGGQKKRGNAKGGIGEPSHKRKCINGKEDCYPQEVCKGFKGTHLGFPLKTNSEENAEKIGKKSVKFVRSRTGRIDGVEGIQGLRRSSRFSNLENTHVFVGGKTGENKPNGVNGESTQLMEPGLTDFADREISPAMTPKAEGEKKKRIVNGGIEDKRTNNNREENCGLEGWTKDQELALQRAYFAAKPSPSFWKKVSKLVPGKSAQECFDKIHSDLVTPPQPQPRSRAKRTNSSPLGHFSLSGSKLLEPSELNVIWPKGKKQKKLHAQKTLRHLVQKRSLVDQGYEADLFSVLEPITNMPTQDFSQKKILSIPECISKEHGFIPECLAKSSSDQKKPLSRFRNSCQTALVSPPVLKQVKNRTLHEKYIDQLHCREARRTAGRTKCVTAKEDMKENRVKKMDVVSVARNALVTEAKDMISKFQELQAIVISDDEDSQNTDDYDGEDGF